MKDLTVKLIRERDKKKAEEIFAHKLSGICKNYETIINKLLACADKDKYLEKRESILKTEKILLKKLKPFMAVNSPLEDVWILVFLNKIKEDFDRRVK